MGEIDHLFQTIMVWQAKTYTNKSLLHLQSNGDVTFVALTKFFTQRYADIFKYKSLSIKTDQEADDVTNLCDTSRDTFC